MPLDAPSQPPPHVRFIPLAYNHADSDASASRLVYTLFPHWEQEPGKIKFIRFTDGITNTLLKATKRRPTWTEEQNDVDAVLVRAYGEGTEVLIDREREAASQLLLASKGLAPPLLARFHNGILYRFTRGKVCAPVDLRQPPVYTGVARHLGEWHARLPIRVPMQSVIRNGGESNGPPSRLPPVRRTSSADKANAVTPDKVTPNVWTVMQRWVLALPRGSDAARKRAEELQVELDRTIREFVDLPGIGDHPLVLSHCDLLSGNVIVLPRVAQANGTHLSNGSSKPEAETVGFIDYEYTTPAPAAFDLANHFAEFGGFDCDYSVLPTRSTRRAFLTDYLASYFAHLGPALPRSGEAMFAAELERLNATVDHFRGIPGLYWGIWALIQATISQIDFDYAFYAEVRLGEYWAWRAEEDGSRARSGRAVPSREARWAEE